MLVVGERGGGFHGSPRRWLWGRGRGGLLMAVTDAGCGGGDGGSYGSPN